MLIVTSFRRAAVVATGQANRTPAFIFVSRVHEVPPLA
jgi:hypothetical protein